jgi:hypothetical protein
MCHAPDGTDEHWKIDWIIRKLHRAFLYPSLSATNVHNLRRLAPSFIDFIPLQLFR